MKIHIIGASGSGKTYLAAALAQKYNLKHFDLDDIYWAQSCSYDVKRDSDERAKLLADTFKESNRVIEGTYYKWTEDSFAYADVVYFLDFKFSVCKRRILLRYLKRKTKRIAGKTETLKSVRALIKWTKEYIACDVPAVRNKLLPYRRKVVTLTSKKQVNALIERGVTLPD